MVVSSLGQEFHMDEDKKTSSVIHDIEILKDKLENLINFYVAFFYYIDLKMGVLTLLFTQ